MMFRLSLFLARRLPLHYTFSGKGGRTSVYIAVTGIALSVAVMIVALSVMTGFSSEIRRKVSGFESQISIYPIADRSAEPFVSMSDLQLLEPLLPKEAHVSLTIRQPAILKTPSNFSGTVIKGIDGDYDVSFIEEALVKGSIPDYSSDSTLYHVVVSSSLAALLEVDLGDRIDAFFLGRDDAYKARRLKIAGIFNTHFSEYDNNLIYGSLSMLQQLCGLTEDKATMAEINCLPSDDMIEIVGNDVNQFLLDRFYTDQTDRCFNVTTIHESAAVIYSWLTLLDTNVKVIFGLMSALALLTLISSLFIMVLRRVNTIGVLKAMGASNALVRSVFISLTSRLLLRGLTAGNIIGLGLVFIQRYTGLIPLNPEAYYLDCVPVEIDIFTVLALNFIIIAVSMVVLIVPSAVISSISPSRVIRYE